MYINGKLLVKWTSAPQPRLTSAPVAAHYLRPNGRLRRLTGHRLKAAQGSEAPPHRTEADRPSRPTCVCF